MNITQTSYGVFESEETDEEIAADPEPGLPAELMQWLTDEGFLKRGDRVELTRLERGFRIALPDFIDKRDQLLELEEQRRNRPRTPKPKPPAEPPPPPITVDTSCSQCHRNRSVIVDGVSYCKRHAREAGLGPTGKIT